MPVRPTPSIVPSEDAAGTLRMDGQISKAPDNGISLLATGVAAPGLFAAQVRPALEASFLLSPNQPTIGGGWGVGSTTAAFTQLPTSVVLVDDDGLDSQTQEVIQAPSGTFGPIDIAGYYAIAASLQMKAQTGGGNPVAGNAQIAARSITPQQGVGAYRQIGGQTLVMGSIEPLPVQTYGRWPFLYLGHMQVATVFPLGRGSFVEFGVRASVNTATVESPGSDSCNASTPHVFAWIVLVRAFAP